MKHISSVKKDVIVQSAIGELILYAIHVQTCRNYGWKNRHQLEIARTDLELVTCFKRTDIARDLYIYRPSLHDRTSELTRYVANEVS